MVAQLTRNLTATRGAVSDDTLDAELVAAAIFLMTGRVEYMCWDTVRC